MIETKRKSIRLNTTGWARWSNGNCARNLSLTIRTIICVQPRIHPGNETHKLLWDFEIQTDHLISARRLDLIIVNNKKREPTELWTLLSRLKLKKSEEKYIDLARELKKTVEHESHGDPIYPTPPLGQDMTQGQFLKRSLADLNSEFSFS